MYGAIFTAATGVAQQQKRIDTIADNVANVNTAGFKSSRISFEDALYVAGGYAYADTGANTQKGHGVLLSATNRIFQPGAVTATENSLDFAIEGDGFFQLASPTGELCYTRAGNFYLSTEGEEQFLVSANGYYVLDESGERISLPQGSTALDFSASGEITFRTADEPEGVSGGRFAILTFANPEGLSAVGSSNFTATEASGVAVQATDFELRQGALEASNVDLAREFTNLIRAQRAFSLASRALTTADDMEGIANNLRR